MAGMAEVVDMLRALLKTSDAAYTEVARALCQVVVGVRLTAVAGSRGPDEP
jgi:hypothetical protein